MRPSLKSHPLLRLLQGAVDSSLQGSRCRHRQKAANKPGQDKKYTTVAHGEALKRKFRWVPANTLVAKRISRACRAGAGAMAQSCRRRLHSWHRQGRRLVGRSAGKRRADDSGPSRLARNIAEESRRIGAALICASARAYGESTGMVAVKAGGQVQGRARPSAYLRAETSRQSRVGDGQACGIPGRIPCGMKGTRGERPGRNGDGVAWAGWGCCPMGTGPPAAPPLSAAQCRPP